MEHTNIDSSTFKQLCEAVYAKILKRNINYKAILCPLKGGFFLSYYIHRKLKIPITYLEISSYNKKQQDRFIIGIQPELESDYFLLCDDIYDSGNTVKQILKMYPHAHFDIACLVSKVDDGSILYGQFIPNDNWVDFFWETM